jgi:hypothetical protein
MKKKKDRAVEKIHSRDENGQHEKLLLVMKGTWNTDT